MEFKGFKEYRCPNCNNLQFKYRILKDEIEIQVKCRQCNSWNTLIINLSPMIQLLKELKKDENKKQLS